MAVQRMEMEKWRKRKEISGGFIIFFLPSYSAIIIICKMKGKLMKPLTFLWLDLYFTCKVDISTQFNIVKYLYYKDAFNF